MATIVVTIKIMPESPEINLTKIEEQAKVAIAEFAGEGEIKAEQQPVAFGLKQLNLMFVMDEAKGATDPLEEKLRAIEGVNSAETIDVRRAIG